MLSADFYHLIALMPTDRDWFMAVGLLILLALSSVFYLGGHKRSVPDERPPASSAPPKRT